MGYATSVEGMNALAQACTRAHALYRPKPPMTLSQWADEYAYIPPEAGAFPGKFFTGAAEYQRGLQDAITDPNIETVVQMLCAQSGKTQIQLNTVGYYSHRDPSPQLFVQASEGEAEKFSKNRVAKMIRVTPVLKELFPNPKTRDSGNTLLNKEFPGGVLILAGANAPAGLASMPIRILQMDEVDRYPESAGTEGDPVDLASRRTTTFWNRKKVLASTPGIKGISRIEKGYEESDQRKYFVPCPHCGEFQELTWPRLKWKTETKEEDSPVVDFYYVCVSGCEIREGEKHDMIRRGEWRATSVSADGKTAGFHLNALYPPWIGWRDLIDEWRASRKSLERKKTFINTRLAETWEIRGKGADLHELEKRKDSRDFRAKLPADVLFLTAGVDVQDNRLEASIIGWGMDDERWVIDHKDFPGDPSLPETITIGGKQVRNEESPWAQLDDYLRQSWEHEFGVTMRVAAALFDSGGHHTQRVYDFTRRREVRRWHACVGRAGIGKTIVSRGAEMGPSHAMLYTVGTDTAKEDIFTAFRTERAGAGYCHFSAHLDTEYFRQVTAEKLVKVTKDFVVTLKWVKKSERNEALDCFVYARGAVGVLKPNFARIKKKLEAARLHVAALEAHKDEIATPDLQREEKEPDTTSPDISNFRQPVKQRPRQTWFQRPRR